MLLFTQDVNNRLINHLIEMLREKASFNLTFQSSTWHFFCDWSEVHTFKLCGHAVSGATTELWPWFWTSHWHHMDRGHEPAPTEPFVKHRWWAGSCLWARLLSCYRRWTVTSGFSIISHKCCNNVHRLLKSQIRYLWEYNSKKIQYSQNDHKILVIY